LIIKKENRSIALENGKYIVTHRDLERVYDERFFTLFPQGCGVISRPITLKYTGNGEGITVSPSRLLDQSGEKTIVKKTSLQ